MKQYNQDTSVNSNFEEEGKAVRVALSHFSLRLLDFISLSKRSMFFFKFSS